MQNQLPETTSLGEAPLDKQPQTSFQSLVALIERSEWRKALSRAAKIYNIKVYNLEKLTLNRVKQIYHTIAEKFYGSDRQKESWNENQLRVFVWMLFASANALQKTPEQFTEENWRALAACFQGKSVHLCEFQYNSLKKLSQKPVKWTTFEDELLTAILQEKEVKNRWNEVAKEFFIRSQKRHFRTSKQCRERWNNYLDPNKRHNGWTIEEDTVLIRTVFEKGKKWALISKQLDSARTQHMVKNRFNSLMCRFLKANNKRVASDNVEMDEFEEWIKTRPEKEATIKLPKQPREGRIKLQVPAEVERPPKPEQRPPTPIIQDKKDDDRMTLNSSFREVKSPMVIVTPMIPTVYTPLVFSPYREFGGFLVYKNQAEGEQIRSGDSESMMALNPFGFHNLMR